MAGSGSGSLTVQFFQSELLGFSDKAEDHEPSNEVQSSVEADCIWVSDVSREHAVRCTYKLQWESSQSSFGGRSS